ncbi:MAG: hypothetical protein PWP71_2455 [Clostridia bacterium]|nr:hypothetical protein [Clostridia bacterium]
MREIRIARKKYCANKKNTGLLEIAMAVGISDRQFLRYEQEGEVPLNDVMINIAETLEDQGLLRIYCNGYCKIGQIIRYPILTNIIKSPVNCLCKVQEELMEANAEIPELLRLIINKRSLEDFSESETKFFWKHYEQILDVGQAIEELKDAFSEWVSVAQQMNRHRNKMVKRGYIKGDMKKEPVLATQAL